MTVESFKFSLTVKAIPISLEKFPRNANAGEILDGLFIDAVSSCRMSMLQHMAEAKCGGAENKCQFCLYLESKIEAYSAINASLKGE